MTGGHRNSILKSMLTALIRRPLSILCELARDRTASALVYTTMSIPALIGFALLAIDGSRLMHLHLSLQHAADAMALNAAAELDRKSDSLTRAKTAVQIMLQNDQRLGDVGYDTISCASDADCDIVGRFLDGLPASDATPINTWLAGDPTHLVARLSDNNLNNHSRAEDARFIEITVKPQNLTTIFPASFLGGSNFAQASASAIAGYNKGTCFHSPVMMCNPFEGNTGADSDSDGIPDVGEETLEQHVNVASLRRRMIEIRQVQKNADYFPGNFAFLAAEGPGANILRDAFACIGNNFCFSEDGITTEPGQQMGPVRQGVDVWFDIYEGPLAGYAANADCRPARNVRKGYDVTPPNPQSQNPKCTYNNAEDGTDYQGFPRDATEYQALGDGRIFNGDWDFDTYWNVNFGHGSTPVPAPNSWSNTNRPARYDVYRCELGDGTGCSDLTSHASVGGETGAPMCYSAGTLSDTPDRRIMNVAIVNCAAEGPLNGREVDVRVYKFAKAFLIRPLDTTGGDTMDIELVDVLDPVRDYQARDTVQLYR